MDTALNREALLEAEKAHWRAATPMGRLGRPDELNGLAVFLASEASAFVTGAEMLVDVSLIFGGGGLFFFVCVFSPFLPFVSCASDRGLVEAMCNDLG